MRDIIGPALDACGDYMVTLFKSVCVFGIIVGIICGLLAGIDAAFVAPAREQAQGKPPWQLLIHPAVGEPVAEGGYASQASCEAERHMQIRDAARQHHAIPALTCDPTLPWGLRLLDRLGSQQTEKAKVAPAPRVLGVRRVDPATIGPEEQAHIEKYSGQSPTGLEHLSNDELIQELLKIKLR